MNLKEETSKTGVENKIPPTYVRVVYLENVENPESNPKTPSEIKKHMSKEMKENKGEFLKQKVSKDGFWVWAWLVRFCKYKDYYNFKHNNEKQAHIIIDSVDERLIDKDWYSFQPKGVIYK